MAKTAVLKPFLAVATDKMKANTVAELQRRTEFKEGDVVEVLGELVAGDGKHHMRIASKVADASGVQGQGGLFWNVVPNSLISLIAQAIEQNKGDILLRALAGGYTGTTADLKSLIDSVTNMTGGFGNGGWFKDRKTGLIIQWGNGVTSDWSATAVFGLAFSTNNYSVSVTTTHLDISIVNTGASPALVCWELLNNQFKIARADKGYGLQTFRWIAIGY